MTNEQVEKLVDERVAAHFKSLEKKPLSDYAREYMREAIANDVTDGTSPGMYATREQLITILGRLGLLSLRATRSPAVWAEDIWAEMTKEGIVDGTRPGAAITREEVAAIVSRAMNKLIESLPEGKLLAEE